MDDLGRAMAGAHGPIRMLGGGNPAHIPEMQAIWRDRMAAILADPPQFDRMMTNYDPPIGNAKFIAALAGLLRSEFGWNLRPENIAVTAGGQTAFFFLFNLKSSIFVQANNYGILIILSNLLLFGNFFDMSVFNMVVKYGRGLLGCSKTNRLF